MEYSQLLIFVGSWEIVDAVKSAVLVVSIDIRRLGVVLRNSIPKIAATIPEAKDGTFRVASLTCHAVVADGSKVPFGEAQLL